MIILQGLGGFSAWLVYNKIVFSMIYLRRFNVAHNDQLALIEQLKTCETAEEFKTVSDLLTTDKITTVFYSHAEIVGIFKDANNIEREKMLLESLTNIELSENDILSLLSLHKDSNNIPYCKANIKNLQVSELMPLLMSVLLSCSDLNVDFSLLSETDLNDLKNKRISITDEANEVLIKSPNIGTGELIALTVKTIFNKLRGVKK